MVHMNVLCVHDVQLHAQVIGGMETNTLDQQFYFKHTDGLLIVEMMREKQG